MLKAFIKLSGRTAVVWGILTILAQAALADSISVSETWKDLTQGGVWSTSSDTGKFNASLTIPGLSNFSANDWSNLVVTINSANLFTAPAGSFSDFMADAPNNGGSVSATNATFIFQSLDLNHRLQNAFQMSFSRSGNTLAILGKTLNPSSLGSNQWTIVAWNYFDPDGLGQTFGITNDPIECEIVLQNADTQQQYADVVRPIYMNGINVITYDNDSDELFNIQVIGSADFIPPVLTAVSPASVLTTTNGLLTAQVKATDNVGVANVEFFLNGWDYGSGVMGASNLWFFSSALAPGTNVIQAIATDVNGNHSGTNTFIVDYVNRQTIANAITFSEHWLDSAQTGFYGDQFDANQDTGILNAALLVPGLQNLSADAWSNLLFTVSFGNVAFTGSLSGANVLTASNAMFYLNQVHNSFSQLVTDVQMSLARSGNTLILAYETANTTYDDNHPIVADFYLGVGGSFQNSQPFALTLQDGNTLNYYANVTRPMFITGSDSTNFDSAGKELDSIQVSGTADYLPPTIQITAPLFNQLCSNAEFTVLGKASDNVQVTNVYCSVNAGIWTAATPTNNWTNWSARVNLAPGTNVIAAYAMDNSGNRSPTNTVNLFYVVNAPLTVGTNGPGSITPKDNGSLLQIGRNYTLTATARAGSGFAFTNWTGGTSRPLTILTSRPTLVFAMASNLMLQANFVDTNRPVLKITNVVSGPLVSNANFVVQGTATDNVAVAGVFCQLNGTGWVNPTSFASPNWTDSLMLNPGTNQFQAYASDTSGNLSPTNTVNLFYVVNALLTVSTNGPGSITPNDNGSLLQIGRNYTLTATARAGSGFAFTNWTGGTNLPLSVLTNRPTLVFEMASNLMLQANFVDTNPPVLKITNVVSAMLISNANFVAQGTATDNVAVAGVSCQLNGMGWVNATSFAGRNWSDTLTLHPGTNQFQAYAVDTSGNLSPTNTVNLLYVVSALLTVSTNGPGSITPNDNGSLLQIGRNYTLTATARAGSGFAFTNWTGGTSLPLTILTNRPTLVFAMASNLMLQANFVSATARPSTVGSGTDRLVKTQPLLFTAGQGGFAVVNGTLLLNLSGPTNAVAVIESSPDLIHWQPIQTNTLPATGTSFSLPVDQQPAKFIRARLQPQ